MPPAQPQNQTSSSTGSFQLPPNGGALSAAQIQQARAQIGLPPTSADTGVKSQWDAYNDAMKPPAQDTDIPDNSLTAQAHRAGQAVGIDALGTGLGVTLNSALGGSGSPDDLLKLSQQHSEQTQKLVQALKDPNLNPDAKQHLLMALKGNTDYAQQAYDDVSTAGVTDKQVLGSAAQTALDIGTAGLGAGVGETALARIGSAAGKFGALGAAQGAANAYGNSTEPGLGVNGTDAENIVKGGIEGGAAGAALGAGGQALGEAAPSLVKGAQTAKQGISDAVSSMRSAGTSDVDKIGETISPKLNAKETKVAINEGRVTRSPSTGVKVTLFGKRPDIVAQSEEVKQAAQTIHDSIPGSAKMDDATLHSALDEKTSAMAQDLQGDMQKVAVAPETMQKVADTWDELKAEQASRPEFLDNEAGNTAFQGKFGNYLKQAKDAGTLDKVWDARKDYDSSIPTNVKQATEISSPILQARKTMWLENRAILNSVINDAASGLGETSRKAFSDMSDMYMARQNILSKAKVDVKGTTGLLPANKGDWLKWGLTTGGGLIGADYVGRRLGLPI